MATYIIPLLLQRTLWPLIIVSCAFIRPAGTSFVYLLMFFISPFIPVASARTLKGPTIAYLIVWIALTSFVLLLHFGLQVAILMLGIEKLFSRCSFTEILLRHIGFINLTDLSFSAIAEWLIPDVLAFFTSITMYAILKRVIISNSAGEPSLQVEDEEGLSYLNNDTKAGLSGNIMHKLRIIGPFVSLASLCVAAVLRPSLAGGLYFLVFLGSGTYWACSKSLTGRFRFVLFAMLVVLVVHIISIFIYQTPWAQEFLRNSSLPARLSGLEPLFISRCFNGDDIRLISFNKSVNIDSYANPLAILICFHITAIVYKSLAKQKQLKRTTSRSKSAKTEQIELNSLRDRKSDVDNVSLCNEVLLGLKFCRQFLYINSYIFTSITMIVWSIVYHSWLTFIMLIWANILWMIPNQRKAMLRSSPFVVTYAQVLLILQYIYAMNLTDAEIPSEVEIKGINLRQIGFVKPAIYPSGSLLVKVCFTLMFWTTMRQLFTERNECKKNLNRTKFVSALNPVTETSPTGLTSSIDNKDKQIFFNKFGDVFKNALYKLWIWLLVLVIFLCGITGQRMTGFRICYMALFLIFVLCFQLSWRAWTRIMYGFWLVLIVYAMTILILIYTYQFDEFDVHWRTYFGITLTLQKDIGLEKYKTQDLFLHLVNPTIIVVMTVIQVHYFHSKFLNSLTFSNENRECHSEPISNADFGEGPSRENENTEDQKNKFNFLKSISTRGISKLIKTSRSTNILDYLWIFTEMHLMKAILLVTFSFCLANVCVVHVFITVLTVLASVSPMKIQILITRIISVLVGILLLAKMIYQVDYINHKDYEAKCDKNSTTTLVHTNNAEWFGLSKISDVTGLATLLKGYITYLVVVTIHALVIFRQEYKRNLLGVENSHPTILFADVARGDADKNLIGLCKFLLNYSYFKFGYEVSLIILVGVIGLRQDLLAVVYVLWLCTFFKLSRTSSSKLWAPFQCFVAVIIILQYLLIVGFPPGFCMEWPWYDSTYAKGFQLWAMVPGQHLQSQTKKLLLDFILLICVHCQHRVFLLERKIDETKINYPAGTNTSILNESDNLDSTLLDNPVPDFVSNTRDWLDVLKVAVLNGWYWLSLAVLFLAGTNTISIFFAGYLIGSFVFLWQGTDFYLRPVGNILKWWKILMTYNIIVIAMKTFLQIGGCLFLNTLERSACWFLHLFGVCCNQSTMTSTFEGIVSPVNECPESQDKSGLTWDAICFAFLLFQRRIFNTYYFHHIINDAKASATMASRGAELIEELREKEIDSKNKHEENIIRQIKHKMEKIRSKQGRMLKKSTGITHYSDIFSYDYGNTTQKILPSTHANAIRAGDYYMFDDLDEKVELGVDTLDDDYLNTLEAKEQEFMSQSTSKKEDVIGSDENGEGTNPEFIKKEEVKSLLRKAIDKLFVSVLSSLRRTSRNYRYVMRILQKEKKILMVSKGFGLGMRTGTGRIWTPFKYSNKIEHLKQPQFRSKSPSTYHTVGSDSDIDELSCHYNPVKMGSDLQGFDDDNAGTRRYIFIEILVATWYGILANTDLFCYIAAILNQVASASLLSFPIPLMIFLWGTLSIPRPTKTFWITLIAYTQTVVLIKCVFQFKMIWFNQTNDVITAAKIIGIQFVDGTAGYDLILLLMLFFHRFSLKSQGLWKSKYTTEFFADGAYDMCDDRIQSDVSGEPSSEQLKDVALIPKNESTYILARQEAEEVLNESETGARVSNYIEEPAGYLPDIIKVTCVRYCSPIMFFLQDLLHKARLPTDVYAYMFLCDFINFLVLVLGFSAFDNQRADGGFQTYLEENRVPLSFLIMLILQFLLIIVDRILYLRKAIKYRLGFHFCLVLGIHVWMFFVIPIQQGRVFNSQTPTVIFYCLKCIYFILSSYQLRCGYPFRISGNFFTKAYSVVNMISFKIYMLIPLLYEFRTLLDWVCTDTTMTVFEWMKMEDLFSEIFAMKCARQMESDLPVQRGVKKPMLTKSLMGGGIIFILFFLIWGPFVIFALSSAVGVSNLPYDVSISLRVGPYEPVYKMSAQDGSIHSFDQPMMNRLMSTYMKSKIATTFLSDYDPSDVAAIVLGSNSASLWNISPPDKARFLGDLEMNQTLTCRFQYAISKRSLNKESRSTSIEEKTFELTSDHPGRISFIEMLQGKTTKITVKLTGIFPKFLKIKGNGDLKPAIQLMPTNKEYRDVMIHYYLDGTTNQSWWQLNEFCEDGYYHNILSQLPLSNCDNNIVLYTFSDKLFPSFLTVFTAGGIIGMYTTIVLVGSRFLRTFITGTSRRIMFEELPYVDRVLQLCLDIYLVREAKEFALEEDLFAKLLFLYRSPETMVKWTRPKTNLHINEMPEV